MMIRAAPVLTSRIAMRRQVGPSVSVVIPAYNRRDFLPAAIASIIGQTYPVDEIIVVDDGSSDGTLEIARDAARDDCRIRVVQRAHGGANRARNAGIAEAGGDWIAFLDSDDQFEPDKIRKQLAALSSRPEAIAAFTGLRQFDAKGERIYIPKDDPSLFALRCCNVLSSTSSAMIRSDVLRDVGGFDPDLESCQDWDLWFRLRRMGQITVVQEPLVRMDTGPHERITNDMDKVQRGHRAVFARLRDGLSGPLQRNRVDSMHRLVLADVCFRHGHNLEAVLKAASSLLPKPTPWATRIIFRALKQMSSSLPRLH